MNKLEEKLIELGYHPTNSGPDIFEKDTIHKFYRVFLVCELKEGSYTPAKVIRHRMVTFSDYTLNEDMLLDALNMLDMLEKELKELKKYEEDR